MMLMSEEDLTFDIFRKQISQNSVIEEFHKDEVSVSISIIKMYY